MRKRVCLFLRLQPAGSGKLAQHPSASMGGGDRRDRGKPMCRLRSIWVAMQEGLCVRG